MTDYKDCALPSNKLPTRALCISGTVEKPEVRLIETASRPGRYLALSYCWGGPQDHATRTTTLSQYLQGIPLSTIPRNIIDTITIAINLGFKYLWVDSFCIVQDSVEDKEREIACMSRIYQNASLTICAAAAKSCHDGFLEMHSLSTRRQQEARCSIPLVDENCQYVGTIQLEVAWRREAPIHLSLDMEPLNQRAWTLQETFLSPRKLYFGTERLLWVCASETVPDGGFLTPADRAQWMDLSGRSNSGLRERDGNIKEGLPSEWTFALELYSARELSVAEDKLPAISAIAAYIHECTQWQYLAGLWRQRLLQCLPWRRSPSANGPPRNCQQWRAPSWSWASIDAGVFYHNTDFASEPLATVEACTSEALHATNPFGQVKDAEIVVRGPLCPVYFLSGNRVAIIESARKGRSKDDCTSWWTIDRSEPLHPLHPPSLDRRYRRSRGMRLAGFLSSNWRPSLSTGDDVRMDEAVAWTLAIGQYLQEPEGMPTKYHATVGLVIVKTEGGKYQRIGMLLGRFTAVEGNFDCGFASGEMTTVTLI
jgi:hypothetical protein